MSARKGNAHAAAALAEYEIPECVAYLWEWIQQLHGRSGAHMSGLNPVSYATIAAWAALSGEHPSSLEVLALMRLDAVLLHPDMVTESDHG